VREDAWILHSKTLDDLLREAGGTHRLAIQIDYLLHPLRHDLAAIVKLELKSP
jgi:hypothetical protein